VLAPVFPHAVQCMTNTLENAALSSPHVLPGFVQHTLGCIGFGPSATNPFWRSSAGDWQQRRRLMASSRE
jgi:hypothetical protein